MTPDRLFHYQRFTEEHFVSLLSEGRLKLSAPNQFNDPWDCRVHYRIPTDSEEIKRTMQHWKELNRKHYPEISEAKRAVAAYEIQSQPEKLKSALFKTEEELYSYLCRQYRIYCLSEKCDVALMWGHYASAHTGVCLEFDAKQMPFSRAIKVTYQSSYPAWNIVDGAYDSLFTKSIDWSYEAEWRLIAEEREFSRSSRAVKTDNDFLIIRPSVIKSVTIGCCADIRTQRRIELLVKNHAPSVVVRHTTLARDRYALEISPSVS